MTRRLLPWLLLVPTPAFAQDGDISDTTLGGVMFVVGVVIITFSGARAAQQGQRLGMEEEGSGIEAVQYLYIGMGGLLAVLGALTAFGIIAPATAG